MSFCLRRNRNHALIPVGLLVIRPTVGRLGHELDDRLSVG